MKNVYLILLSTFLFIANIYGSEVISDPVCTNGFNHMRAKRTETAKRTEIKEENVDAFDAKRKRVKIDFSEKGCLSEKMKYKLASGHTIECLTLDQTPLSEADLKLISALSSLKSLSAIGCGLRKGNLGYFNIPSLEQLYISHNQFALADLKDLTTTRSVTVFHCWGIPFGDEGIQYIVNLMPNLIVANFSACNLQEHSLVYILMLKHLEKVVLSHNDFPKQKLDLFRLQAQQRGIEVVI
jgi:hypothetical protein